MNLAQKIAELKQVYGDKVQVFDRQKISIKVSLGWLWIDDDGDSWFVSVASNKAHHNSMDGPLFAANIDKLSGDLKSGPGDLSGCWKTALTLWPVSKDRREDVEYIFGKVKKTIEQCYSWYLGNKA